MWWKDGVPLPGTSGPFFGLSAAQLSDDGVYTCVAATAGGNRESAGAVAGAAHLRHAEG